MINKIENHINRLKEKPEYVRKRIAFLTSFSVSLVILLGWLASYGISSQVSAKGIIAKAPLQSLSASVGDVFSYVKDIFSGSNTSEYSSPEIEIVPGKR